MKINKFKNKIALGIKSDLNLFLNKFNKFLSHRKFSTQKTEEWLNFCQNQKIKYNVHNEKS